MDPSDEVDSQSGDDDLDFGADFQFDNDLVHDIEELGEEERRMLQILETEPDEADNAVVESKSPSEQMETKVQANINHSVENGLGKSEEDAIALSDDDEEPDEAAVKSTVVNTASAQPVNGPSMIRITIKRLHSNPVLRNDDILDGCRVYRICFTETKLGLEIDIFNGRIVVTAVRQERIDRLGPNSKPGVGDILCGIKRHAVGVAESLPFALHYLKRILQNTPIEFLFLEAPKFIAIFQNELAQVNRTNLGDLVPPMTTSTISTAQNSFELQTKGITTTVPDVIELLDD